MSTQHRAEEEILDVTVLLILCNSSFWCHSLTSIVSMSYRERVNNCPCCKTQGIKPNHADFPDIYSRVSADAGAERTTEVNLYPGGLMHTERSDSLSLTPLLLLLIYQQSRLFSRVSSNSQPAIESNLQLWCFVLSFHASLPSTLTLCTVLYMTQ